MGTGSRWSEAPTPSSALSLQQSQVETRDRDVPSSFGRLEDGASRKDGVERGPVPARRPGWSPSLGGIPHHAQYHEERDGYGDDDECGGGPPGLTPEPQRPDSQNQRRNGRYR